MYSLFKNSLYSFSLISGSKPIIFFDWTDKSVNMSYEDFQESCHNYAGFAWQYKAKHLLVNTCNFQFQLPPDFPVWREEILNPRYYELGVQKFAYVTKPGLLAYMKDIEAIPGKFETRNFENIDGALKWLNI
jgi:hypothetical protein